MRGFVVLPASWSTRLSFTALLVDVSPVSQKFVGSLHRHTAKVRNEMSTISVAGDVALGTFSRILASKRQHIATVTTPVGSDICKRFETMWNTVVDLFFIALLEADFNNRYE